MKREPELFEDGETRTDPTAADIVLLPMAVDLDGERDVLGELFLVRDMVVGISAGPDPARATVYCAGGHIFTVATSPRAALMALVGLEAATGDGE